MFDELSDKLGNVFAKLRVDHPSVERLLVAVLAARVNRLSGHLVEALYLKRLFAGIK